MYRLSDGGSNATETISNLEKSACKGTESLPTGLNINIKMPMTLFASIHEVIKTLIEHLFWCLLWYIFLQDMRSTLIPAIAIPVALVATFFVPKLIGFGEPADSFGDGALPLRLWSMMPLSSSRGVHAKLDQGYKSSREASIDAMMNWVELSFLLH